MIQRDKLILKAIEKFRCLERYHIEKMYFTHCKRPYNNANISLKRLRDRGYIVKAPSRMPYVYLPKINSIKRNSNKIDHFLAMADVYLELGLPKTFDIEPRYKADVRPDIFTIYKRSPYFIEVQKSLYTTKVMQKKIDLYEEFYASGEWKKFWWQPKNDKYKPFFPFVIILTEAKYPIKTTNVKVKQYKDVNEFILPLQEKGKGYAN
ncbi:hypothetical protein J2S74_005385 [Evansella vedderi]|uniref:Replication-relaxation n=1 Tax=Evansella vedderi TaxID=38282 RepID=A0ABU0A4H1_9BACI|nr:hypothetical protein [Evansella vedderi]MDQ0257922.1 hypothetical protein [Evansella vedderi]